MSSTSRDLAEYREAVHRAIDGLPGFRLVKMEDFGARDMSARDLCARLVRECDLFVGLMGHYYGSCPPGETVSFTELEYRTAKTANLPRLMFVAPDDFRIPARLRESDASFERQQTFRREVMADRVVAAFDTSEKLASAVTRALFVWDMERRQAAETGPPGGSEGTEPAVPKPLGPNPYRGLEAFRKEDANRFFGREALVDQLWNEFLELHATRTAGEPLTRLMAILGASGSGKSSVAQAGLLSELERRPLPGRPAPLEVVLTPESRPLESLAVALARDVTKEASPAKKAIEFEQVLRARENHDGLRYLSERMLDVGGSGVILLVDQFEELYSLCDNEQERADFIWNLINAGREPQGRVSILLILRSDFLGAVNQHPELSRLIARQNVVLPAMSEEELRRAIEEPAKRAGREIDTATVDLLIEQSRGRKALPSLEFVLASIWEGFGRAVPAVETVRALGGVGGALTTRAQAVYESLGLEEREIARRAFVAMFQPGEVIPGVRRPVRVSEMLARGQSADQVLRVLRRFADPGCRLITLTSANGTTVAEVTHEALFDHWPLLRDWLNASRQDLWSGLRLTRVLKTAYFRSALIYLASFGLSALALLGFLYYATTGFMERHTAETIQAEIAGLAEQYRAEGLEGLRQVIGRRSAAQPHRASVYLLVDPAGRPVAGNLDGWPQATPDPGGWLTFAIEVSPEGETVERRRARATTFLLPPDGYRLLVGREVEESLQLQAAIRRALGWGLALTLLLGLAGGFLMSRGMLGRVDAINRTARRIMAGDLSQRIALKGSRDEFDQLAANLNAMLDQIERLQDRPRSR